MKRNRESLLPFLEIISFRSKGHENGFPTRNFYPSYSFPYSSFLQNLFPPIQDFLILFPSIPQNLIPSWQFKLKDTLFPLHETIYNSVTYTERGSEKKWVTNLWTFIMIMTHPGIYIWNTRREKVTITFFVSNVQKAFLHFNSFFFSFFLLFSISLLFSPHTDEMFFQLNSLSLSLLTVECLKE